MKTKIKTKSSPSLAADSELIFTWSWWTCEMFLNRTRSELALESDSDWRLPQFCAVLSGSRASPWTRRGRAVLSQPVLVCVNQLLRQIDPWRSSQVYLNIMGAYMDSSSTRRSRFCCFSSLDFGCFSSSFHRVRLPGGDSQWQTGPVFSC